MTGIDATVVLGMAAKVEQVFAEDGAYHGFPMAPIGIRADSLMAMANDPFGAGAAAQAQFSLLVNEIPEGPLWQPDGDRLWTVYADVLGANVDDVPRTPAQEAAYRSASALLYVEDGGRLVPSPTMIAYQQYRDAFLAAGQEYNNRRGAAELSTDPAVKAKWSADEPALAAAVTDASTAWTVQGRRADVEKAQRTIADLGSSSPILMWEKYRQLYDPTGAGDPSLTTPDGLTYLPTGILPSNVTQVEWARITVTAGELAQLVAQAPADLRSRLAGGGDSGTEVLTFEYSFVTVTRPWFAPEVFASHAWRFADASRILSDGGSPPKGQCTAYVSGLVLARNVTVQRRTVGGTPPDGSLGFVPVQTNTSAEMLTAPAALSARATGAPVSPMVPAIRRSVEVREGPPIIWKPGPQPVPNPPVVTTTDPGDVFVLAFQCRLLPKAPDPTPLIARQAPALRVYKVVSGDSLGKIAARFYGNAGLWRKLYDANRPTIGKDPNRLRIGQKLTIP
ncbi:LysM peptidoglycan-binding domain-containing protein [Kribbella sindirgiensis]|uniref:LysM peptidoglycan-binding domain-containing protein n=1 Tax=Kribbella sindirgiensis TaxID=1124744 RepID=A0A4R0JAX3_9ACTN|nr:LysM peptidoglycan-binding domain-containing protein [Kribbella sindirgiensis]TCC43399.1 LysM peptidoglycan-binding domain-containing protein [Kribbella sindirgiensis]